MRFFAVLFAAFFTLTGLTACGDKKNEAKPAEKAVEAPENTPKAANAPVEANGGKTGITTCVAKPNNSVYGETVSIKANGDQVTHMQIITASNIKNPNNDFQLKSYKHWVPILDKFYNSQIGTKFSADRSAGTWTIDADINDSTIKALGEYYLDFSPMKKGDFLSKALLVRHYESIMYTCDKNT